MTTVKSAVSAEWIAQRIGNAAKNPAVSLDRINGARQRHILKTAPLIDAGALRDGPARKHYLKRMAAVRAAQAPLDAADYFGDRARAAARQAIADNKARNWRYGQAAALLALTGVGLGTALSMRDREPAGDAMKTSEHKHKWTYMYLPGDCWRYCKCGEVEETDPDGNTKPVNEKTRQMVLRKAKLASYDSRMDDYSLGAATALELFGAVKVAGFSDSMRARAAAALLALGGATSLRHRLSGTEQARSAIASSIQKAPFGLASRGAAEAAHAKFPVPGFREQIRRAAEHPFALRP